MVWADLSIRLGDAVFVLLVMAALAVCVYFAGRLATALLQWAIERSDRRGW